MPDKFIFVTSNGTINLVNRSPVTPVQDDDPGILFDKTSGQIGHIQFSSLSAWQQKDQNFTRVIARSILNTQIFLNRRIRINVAKVRRSRNVSRSSFKHNRDQRPERRARYGAGISPTGLDSASIMR